MKEETTGIELPRDAVGREISLDTKVLYTADGIEVHVNDFVYGLIIHVNESAHSVVSNGWRVHSGSNVFDVNRLYLKQPDSLKKLLEDLDRAGNANNVCMYFSESGTCLNCAIRNTSGGCSPKALEHILERIRELRGEGQ